MGSLSRSIFAILAGKSSGIVIGVLFTPILVRILSQEHYGVYASVLAGFSILALFFKGGLFDATRKTIAEHDQDRREVSTIISLSVLLSLCYGVVGTALILISYWLELIPDAYALYVLVLSGALVAGNIFSIVRGSFYGLQEEHWGEYLGIARRLLYAVAGLGLAYIGYDLLGVFVGYTTSFVLLSIVGLVIIFDRFSLFLPGLREIRSRGREIAAYGGFQLIGGLSSAILYKVDILLVEFFRGSTSTALYNSAIIPAEMIWFVPSVIQMAFLQHTASLWADDDVDIIDRNIRTGLRYGVLSLTLFGVGLFVLAEPFLEVYFGDAYTGAATTLRILVFGTFFFGVSRVLIPVFQATGWIRVTEFIAVGALLLNIALNVVLIPRYGIVGAGIGTMISYVALFVGAVLIWIRSPFEVVSVRWSGRLLFVQLLFAVSYLSIASTVAFSPFVSLLVLPPVGFVLFVGFNAVAGYVSVSELNSILRSVAPD